ncbi:MAG: YggS family pyridoxal phosphate-dependent enzyme [Pelagibacterales bacterium]|nr:YggS family pyridoxal phosphate-dependent enzyme [Pelagibacterales bacterium]
MSVINNYKKIIENIKATCKKYNKNYENINIVAVSKQQTLDKIKSLYNSGHNCFGENKLNEANSKWETFEKGKVKLHFIGALQSKKIKEIIKIFDVIETLDTESSAKKISLLKSNNIKIPKIFIQINIGEEPQKRGVAPSDFSDFYNMCKIKYGLEISGAMSMPPMHQDPKIYFKNMFYICKKENIENISMGMSNDYQEAIIQGANNLRIGSSIFGERGK